jgi:glutamyl-tRNA synthetase
MTVRVRFAPSPTGYLHIGGARTAMYNYLFAKAMGGKYILRIEDTDLERSKREFEDSQIGDLKWLGLVHDEGPDVGGEYGPYRQSERGHIYASWAQKLIDTEHAYYCFCSEEELTAKKELANLEKRAPHYDGKCRNLSLDEATSRLAAGEEAVIRFKAPRKAYVFNDHVRGRVVFPEGMVGDFVVMRANGVPVYNYAVVVDDASMKISHVIRAEEHLPNTLRQLMLYEAFNETPPEFAHVSLLIGEDRQKLSKRHGATSVNMYKDMNYLPDALLNYLLLLGWSHPEDKDVF